MKQEVNTIEEAENFIAPLIAENKWAVTVSQKADGTFLIQWIEHKKYTTIDGKEYLDEVWTTKDGVMVLVQDMSPDHARNTLRMLLRNERNEMERLKNQFAELVDEISAELSIGEDDEEELLPNFGMPENHTIH